MLLRRLPLILSLAVIASCTTEDRSGWRRQEQLALPSVALTSNAPAHVFDLEVTTREGDRSIEQLVGDELEAVVTATYLPAGSEQEPVELSITLAPADDLLETSEVRLELRPAAPQETVAWANLLPHCTDAEDCTARFTLTLAAGDPVAGGEVQLEATVIARFSGIAPYPPPGWEAEVTLAGESSE